MIHLPNAFFLRKVSPTNVCNLCKELPYTSAQSTEICQLPKYVLFWIRFQTIQRVENTERDRVWVWFQYKLFTKKSFHSPALIPYVCSWPYQFVKGLQRIKSAKRNLSHLDPHWPIPAVTVQPLYAFLAHWSMLLSSDFMMMTVARQIQNCHNGVIVL